jgi:hypothetical protein
MSQPNDLSRCLVSLDQDSTLIAVIELSQSSWLIAGTVPGVEQQPLKKIVPDEAALLRLFTAGAMGQRPLSSGLVRRAANPEARVSAWRCPGDPSLPACAPERLRRCSNG